MGDAGSGILYDCFCDSYIGSDCSCGTVPANRQDVRCGDDQYTVNREKPVVLLICFRLYCKRVIRKDGKVKSLTCINL